MNCSFVLVAIIFTNSDEELLMDLVFSEVSKAGLFCCGEVVRPEQSDVGCFPSLDNVLKVLVGVFQQG